MFFLAVLPIKNELGSTGAQEEHGGGSMAVGAWPWEHGGGSIAVNLCAHHVRAHGECSRMDWSALPRLFLACVFIERCTEGKLIVDDDARVGSRCVLAALQIRR